MTQGSERIFRASALQRAASPDELDHLVAITKPSDWILAIVLTVGLAGAGRGAVRIDLVRQGGEVEARSQRGGQAAR